MYDLSVKTLPLEGKPVSWHIARDICLRGMNGKIAVVTDRPEALLSATRKQWFKLLRHTQNERSGTLNPTRINMLKGQILWMRGLSFTSKPPDDLLEANITFATADDFARTPPICGCIYVTYNFEREKLHMLTAWMPRNATVIIYEQK